MGKIIKNKFVRGILIAVIVIVVGIIYFYPVQKYLAIKNTKEYIRLQGTDMDNVESMLVYKSIKRDGYTVSIKFKDDPEFIYTYNFSPSFNIVKMFSYKSIDCLIWDEKYTSVKVTGKIKDVKYLPLDKNMLN